MLILRKLNNLEVNEGRVDVIESFQNIIHNFRTHSVNAQQQTKYNRHIESLLVFYFNNIARESEVKKILLWSERTIITIIIPTLRLNFQRQCKKSNSMLETTEFDTFLIFL